MFYQTIRSLLKCCLTARVTVCLKPTRPVPARGLIRVCAFSLCLMFLTAGNGLTQTAVNSKADAISAAQQQNGTTGKVLSVKTVKDGDAIVYIVKLLTDGRVTLHKIPGPTQ